MSDISRLEIDAEFAFLAACFTALARPRYSDESIHLAAGFQLAGYRTVIATLWEVGDTAAVRFAERVYSARDPAVAGEMALAVRDALKRHRDIHQDRPSVWAGYVVYGA